MKLLPFMALMLTTLSVASTFAKVSDGAGSSGGGNALVCFDTPEIPKQIRERDQAGNIIDGSIRNEHIKHITSLEILDLVEAKFKKGMSQPTSADLIQPIAGEDAEAYSRRIIGRLKNIAPVLHDRLMKRLEEMPAGEAIAQPDGLYSVNDYNLLGRIDSVNCVVGTVAINLFPTAKNQGVPQLYVDERLMFHPKHSEFSKVVTYLHEVVYSYARSDLKHTDSQNARKVVGLLIKKNVDLVELEKVINSSDFQSSSREANYETYLEINRSDRLGLVLGKINAESFNRMTSIANKNVLVYQERYLAKLIKEAQDFLGNDCGSLDSCSGNLYEIANSKDSLIWKKNKDNKAQAKKILEKFNSFQNDTRVAYQKVVNPNSEYNTYARKALILDMKESLKKLYQEDFQSELLEISNVSSQNLQELDLAIMSAFEGDFEASYAVWDIDKSYIIFSNILKILPKIPVQNTL